MKLRTSTLGISAFALATLCVCVIGCDTGTEDDGASAATDGSESAGGENCELGEAPITLDIQVDPDGTLLEPSQTPCVATGTGFECDFPQGMATLNVTLGGVDALPWQVGDELSVTTSLGSTTIMNVLEVDDAEGQLLGLAIDGDPGFQTSLEIVLEDAGCSEADGDIPLRAVYSIGESSVSILGAGEAVLAAPAGDYRIRQQAAGRSTGNPDMPDYVVATVFFEG